MHPPLASLSPPTLACVIQDALAHLQALGYSAKYMRRCRSIWTAFARFAADETLGKGDAVALVSRFLASRGLPPTPSPGTLSSHQRMIQAVMRVLTEFALHGCYQRRCRVTQQITLPAPFHDVLQSYADFCTTQLRCSRGTMRMRMRNLTRWLHFLTTQHVQTVQDLHATHLSAFVRSQLHLQPRTVAVLLSDLRSFLRFLCLQGLVPADLSVHVPTVRIPRDARLPAVWRPEDVEALLAAVDRSSPKGKRDYAMLLLACRLGLRVSDIRTLRLEHLHWHVAELRLTQTKTRVPLTLPLSEEVGQALIDYLRHGRPRTHYREVFLRVNAPLEPFGADDNLYHIITFYRRRAQIALPSEGQQGMHALRHTVATRLLATGTPLETIAAILGHRSLASTQLYTKVDIETLRHAALDVEDLPHA